MKKSFIARSIAGLLMIALLMPQTVAMAATNDVGVETFVSTVTDDEAKEISRANGMYMYFHDTPEYTIAINIYASGILEIAKYDKVAESLNQKVGNVNEILGFSASTLTAKNSESLFASLEQMTGAGSLVLDENLDNMLYSNTTSTMSVSDDESEIAAKIDTELTSIFGSPYSNKYRGSLTSQGYTAYLYESMHFERYKHYSWILNAGATLSAVAALISLPASTVLKICTFVGTAVTGYSLYSDMTANKYVANVHNNKIVKVGTIYPYRSGRSEYGYCYVGDKSAAYVSRDKVSKDFDFDDNNALLETGIYNYINYN